MKQEWLALVQRQLEAYNARDIDVFCSCFHPEVKVVRLVSNEVRSTNIDQFREGYRQLFAENPDLHCELKSRIILDSAVVDEEFITGLKTMPSGLHALAIYAFRDGLIDRVWFPR